MNKKDLYRRSWRTAMIVWFAVEKAPISVLERLCEHDSGGLWPVYSYVPVQGTGRETEFELIVPSQFRDCGKPHVIDGDTLDPRPRWPKPGTVEVARLVRPFAITAGECSRVLKDHRSWETVPQRLRDRVLEVSRGVSVAYRSFEEGNLGTLDIEGNPTNVKWTAGDREDDFPMSKVILRDGSYIRIFPYMASDKYRNHIPYRPSYWKYRECALPFVSPPKIGTESRVVIRWMITLDNRVVGHAYRLPSR